MRVTVKLEGAAARQIMQSIAHSYAVLCIKSRLTNATGTVNAPWFKVKSKGESMADSHRKWIRTVDREKASYRKALESIFAEVPAAPEIDWPEYKRPDDGKIYPVMYNAGRAHEAARKYAESVVGMLK